MGEKGEGDWRVVLAQPAWPELMSPLSLQLGQEGKVPLQSAYLYYNVTEKVRHMMESYFRLEVPLHFSYSHLVCRTAIDGERSPRSTTPGGAHLLQALVWVLSTTGVIWSWSFPWRPPCCSLSQKEGVGSLSLSLGWEDEEVASDGAGGFVPFSSWDQVLGEDHGDVMGQVNGGFCHPNGVSWSTLQQVEGLWAAGDFLITLKHVMLGDRPWSCRDRGF